ncbi:protein-disulfide reductase DsbD family protein [Vibrio coralliirubri]|uniref:protein-disulfide reductase DsbD family protein n=1 Tax=Vibrio coralliirubri TaxID=1516159 RepID=UPI0006392A23|nr:protein-disulfide reductase DsbD domain-containing protein [Vibrio coralliirubri]CDU02790.1 putative Thiol:disulfide interchange protein [Vibrio coralliirubri]
MPKSKMSLHFVVLWLFVALCSTFTVNASASESMTPVTTGWMQDKLHPYVETRFVMTGQINKEDKTAAGYLEVNLSDEWKTYWRSPGEGGIAPKIKWADSKNVSQLQWFWKFPQRFNLLGIDTLGYKHNIIFPMNLHIDDMNKPVELNAVLTMSSCTTICILTDFDINLVFNPSEMTVDNDAMLVYAKAMSEVPKDSPLVEGTSTIWDARKSQLQVIATHQIGWTAPDVIVDGDSDEMQDADFGIPHIEIEGNQVIATYDVSSWMGTPDLNNQHIRVSIKDKDFITEYPTTVTNGIVGNSSMISMVLLALLGGLILNIMPCVFPVLGMKLSGVISAQGMARKQVRFQFLASASGILASFWLIATFLAVLKVSGSVIGWGIQFQNGWFIGGMFIVTALFSANMLGLFEIRLSSNANTWMATKGDSSYVGHFTQGMFATLLATPCSAPFLGTAVAFALATTIPTMFGIFTALAVGMALPWILVAAFPSIALALPKPGAWMNRVKYLFGGMMLITSVWLFSLLRPHVPQLWLYAILAVSVCLLLVRLVQVHGIKTAGAVALLLLSVISASLFVEKATSKMLPPEPEWEALSTEVIDEHVANGQVVFVDVTADWCVTCKANKIGVLLQDPVYSALTEGDVVPMEGDWTVPSDSVTSYLQDHNRFGVPFNMVYGPNAPEGIELPVILTSDAVMEAIEKARGDDE